ncbi:MAG TPA: o-succinylbenzoate synthase [Polyangiaceae bacterium]|nr:o-succinylbenzoate synthase [Polyangiaceae bacterium]
MSQTRIHIARHAGKLPASVGNARQHWSDRAGILVRLHTATGEIAQGEASPLPDYSLETLDAAAAALQSATADWVDATLALGGAKAVLSAVQSHPIATVPSARFAMETALLDALGQRTLQPIWRLLTDSPTPRMALAQLLDLTDKELLDSSSKAWNSGVRCFKVKVGVEGEWNNELRQIRALRERFGPALHLRIDANRSFAGATLLARLRELATFAPQFVEEPVAVSELFSQPRVPVAIGFDETLAEPSVHAAMSEWVERHPGSIFVLKPMKLGGFLSCLNWARTAQRLGARCVFSHLFDGPVARAAAAHLALAVGDAHLPAGLGTHRALDTWPRLEVEWISAGAISPPQGSGLAIPALSLEES